MSEYIELLIGCGHARRKLLAPPNSSLSMWCNLVTVDENAECNADILCNLDHVPWNPSYVGPSVPRSLFDEELIFFADSMIDEIHAYEVLEHLGQQGHVHSFFSHFAEMWRILKPGGYLCATVPSRYSPWLWGDPGHRRAILPQTLIFLDQTSYASQLGRTAMSDYRGIYKADFKVVSTTDDRQFHSFILQAMKPAR